ncbi:MAG: phosphotransferase [Planctomycetota bacterium]
MHTGNRSADPQGTLSKENPTQILDTLRRLGICTPHETLSRVEKAGEGNMNLVLRVITDQRSVIVKQSRPWVEKYPSIAAPAERLLAEIEFYDRVASDRSLRSQMPGVIAADPVRHLMVLEDLGLSSDFSCLYGTPEAGIESETVFEHAMAWLERLHDARHSTGGAIGCQALRELNHEHMFVIPVLNPPAIDLNRVCSGLHDASHVIRSDPTVQRVLGRLGQMYLQPDVLGEKVLLHGDYYPGSWLRTEHGFRVIDPEFCFLGPREFDLGVMAAHRVFCHADADMASIKRLCNSYGHPVAFDRVCGFTGVELMRRLVGVAQLPLAADLGLRVAWLEFARELLAFASQSWN